MKEKQYIEVYTVPLIQVAAFLARGGEVIEYVDIVNGQATKAKIGFERQY